MTLLSRPVGAKHLLSSLLLLALSAPAHALTYLVGAGAVPNVCDFNGVNGLQLAINAAANNPGEDFIRVASDQTYDAQALTIGQQDLTITGGYANCTAAAPPLALPTASTIVSGAGGAVAPVISITGSGVRVLSNLQIRNGDNVQGNGTGCGGGVRFVGSGELVVRNSGISQNTANTGGGICFTGNAFPTALTIDRDVSINNNQATTGNGGGIAIGGIARLYVLRERTLIGFNSALNGNGGGIYMQAPARADIGSPGFNGLGVLYANQARNGGGVAGVAPDGSGSGHSCLRFFTTDAAFPMRIQENRASNVGGAIYLRTDTAGFPSLDSYRIEGRAYDFRIDGNTAPNGPAIFLDGDDSLGIDDGSTMLLNVPSIDSDCNEPLAASGRVPCTNLAACNRIENNRAQDLNGQATNGNVIELRKSSAVKGNSVTMTGNAGTRLLNWSGSSSAGVRLNHCGLIGNTLTQELMSGFIELGYLELRDCTIAGNAIGNTHVLRHNNANALNTLVNVLIDQPGKLTLAHPNVSPTNFNIVNDWVLASDTSTLRPNPTVLPLQGRARFVDAGRGDYRLRVGSAAVDYTPMPSPPVPNELDLDFRPRNVDLQDVSVLFGARDVGAYERQITDRWLPNGDFVSDLRLWSNPNLAHSTWTDTFNAPGSAGGSLLFSVPVEQVGPTERRPALVQCFNVPSPGEYQITGMALAPGGTTTTRDSPLVNWQLRYNSEACSGPAAISGDRFFGRSSTVWQALTTPLFIAVDPAQWTWNTSIEVRLEVAQNLSSPFATGLIARFDEIEITKVSSDLIFANGFQLLPSIH